MKLIRHTDDRYEFDGHSIVFSRAPGKKSKWTMTVAGPVVNSTGEFTGKRDALARQAASGIMIAKRMAKQPAIAMGRIVK